MASRDSRDFVTPGLHIQNRHKFRCPKPYEDERFKKKNLNRVPIAQKLRSTINKSDLVKLKSFCKEQIQLDKAAAYRTGKDFLPTLCLIEG